MDKQVEEYCPNIIDTLRSLRENIRSCISDNNMLCWVPIILVITPLLL